MKVCKTVLIVGQGRLAEPISQLFRREGIYFGVFESPERFTDNNGRFHNTVVKIANAIKALQPAVIILAGCSERSRNHFRTSFDTYEIREIDEVDEVSLSGCPGFIRQNRRLALIEYSRDSDLVGDVVVVDPKDDISMSIARNLSVAMNAKLVVLPAIGREEVDEFHDSHYRWNSADDAFTAQTNREILLERLRVRLGGIVAAELSSITFVTEGVPYGVIPFLIPATHLFNFPAMLGLAVARGIAKTFLNIPRTPLAVLVAPDVVVGSEVEEAKQILGNDGGYVVRSAVGAAAQASRVAMLTEHMPSDLIVYSSHAGEIEGERATFEFEHPVGTNRRIVYDRVLTFNPLPGGERIQVVEFKRFVSFDGIQWPVPPAQSKFSDLVIGRTSTCLKSERLNCPVQRPHSTLGVAYAFAG